MQSVKHATANPRSEAPVLHLQPPAPQEPITSAPFKSVTQPDGSLYAQFFDWPGGYLIRVRDLADYLFDPDLWRVTCQPVPGVDPDLLQNAYLNEIVPLARSTLGQLALHASAVDVAGRALAFAGPSGAGKSTMATGFGRAGYAVITEDSAILAPGDPMAVMPGHPSLRLWSDSRVALLNGRGQAKPRKLRIERPARITFAAEPVPLGALFHIDPEAHTAISLTRLSTRDAMTATMQTSFLLDDRHKAALAAHFDQLGTVARAVPHFALRYPRCYDALPEVRAAILDAMAKEEAG